MSEAPNTHNVRVDFGKHAGKLWTRVPIPYLRWMINTGHSQATMARAELDRRGIPAVMDFEVRNHAIDRASQFFLEDWQAERDGDEGLCSWIYRRAAIAIELARDIPPSDDGSVRVDHRGICFVIQMAEEWPVVLTVMKNRNAKE